MKEASTTFATYFSLFFSSSTLICCALPAIFVALGSGAAFASLTESVPFLFTISEHKGIIFFSTTLVISATGFILYRNRFAACPADPALARACMRIRRLNRFLYLLSVGVFLIGFYFAYGDRLL